LVGGNAFHARIAGTLQRNCGLQSPVESVDLDAWLTKARDLQKCVLSELQHRARAEFNQIKVPRCDILAERAGCYVETERLELFDQLFFDEMDLAQVRPGGGGVFAF
jgi:hypothetical protein